MDSKNYSAIAQWADTYGWVEIGQDEYSTSFVRALDMGGTVWEGKASYSSLADALQDLDNNLRHQINQLTNSPQKLTLTESDIQKFRTQIKQVINQIDFRRHWETIREVIAGLDKLHNRAEAQLRRGQKRNALILLRVIGEEVILQYEQIEEECQLADFLDNWAIDLTEAIRDVDLSTSEKQEFKSLCISWSRHLDDYGLEKTLDDALEACIE
jgi:hypothetical protein